MPPSVSINLCCYNSEKYLRETLESIVNQTYKNWELIIIDDGSTDSTPDIIREFINRGYQIIYHWQENHGLSYSRNEALNLSRGEYIAFIDHDDIWDLKKIEEQITLFNNPEVGLVYTLTQNAYSKKMNLNKLKKQYSFIDIKYLIRNNDILLSSAMILKEALQKLSYSFDTTLKYAEEYDLFIRISYLYKVIRLNKYLTIYRISNEMTSLKYFNRGLLEGDYIILRLIINNYDDFINNYSDIVLSIRYRATWQKFLGCILIGRTKEARQYLLPFIGKNIKCLFFYLLSFFGSSIIKLLWNYHRKINGTPPFIA